MKRWKKYLCCLLLGVSAAALMAGCKKKPKETETETQTAVQTETEDTEAEIKTGVIEETKLYTARDKSFSITLPGESWKNTKDANNTLVFEASEGSITITHLTGSSVSAVTLPSTKEEVLANFTAAGKTAENYEVTEFEKRTAGNRDQYHTVIKCSDPDEDYLWSIGYDIATATEIYSVTGLVKTDDEKALEDIRDAVESFRILSTGTGSRPADESDAQGSGQNGQTTGTTRVIYANDGTAITVTKNADGTWADGNGKTYDLQDYGAMGSDGYWYTYQPRNSDGTVGTGNGNNSDPNNGNNNGNNGDNNNGQGGDGTTPSAETGGFYDQDGNYITVTKDANGNWVDAYGTVYYFGETGVTDNAGNYYPYKGSSETNGFYDNNGNYIVVTKDANGNWVDTNGAKYVFGEDGVTDESGNFYPY